MVRQFQKVSCLVIVCLLGSQHLACPADDKMELELTSARKLINEHRYKQADSLLKSLLATYPDNAQVHMAKAELLRETGQIEQASRQYAKAAEIASSDPYPLISLAELALKQLELDMSLSYAQQAVAREPACLPARVCLVNILLQCEQTGEAERQLKYFPPAAKEKADVQLLWYKLSQKKGDYVEAKEHLRKAISRSQDTGLELRLEQCDLLQTIGDYSAAKKELDHIVSHKPDSLPARLRLARLLESQFHDYSGALSNYNEVLKADPLSGAALAGRDRCQIKGRNIALQLKLSLKEFWSKLMNDGSSRISNKL